MGEPQSLQSFGALVPQEVQNSIPVEISLPQFAQYIYDSFFLGVWLVLKKLKNDDRRCA